MKPKHLSEVLDLIQAPEFLQWWGDVQRVRAETGQAQQRYDLLLSEATLLEFKAELSQKNAIDTLYRAGECEDGAANMLFEATELENRSYRAISDFEEQRFKVSELWYRLGASEKMLEEKREAHAQATKKSEGELRDAERAHRSLSDEFEKQTARKNQLWEEVEQIWAHSAEVNLLVAEQRFRGMKIRKEAEALFALAEERKRQSVELRAQAEAASSACEAAQARVKSKLNQAREMFGCAIGSEFLYFQQKNDQKTAFCVPLVEDHDHHNVEVSPLSVYLVDKQRGVFFLEPAPRERPSSDETDRRFEDYFLRGRTEEAHPDSQ